MATVENNKMTKVVKKPKIIRATCKWYREVVDTKNPKVKRDLSLKNLQDIAGVNKEFAQWLYGGLGSGKLDTKISLKKMTDEQLQEVIRILNVSIDTKEDLEDILWSIAEVYDEYLKKNNKNSETKITPAKVKIVDLVFYIVKYLNKDIDLKIILKNINDFRWSIDSFDYDTASYIRGLL